MAETEVAPSTENATADVVATDKPDAPTPEDASTKAAKPKRRSAGHEYPDTCTPTGFATTIPMVPPDQINREICNKATGYRDSVGRTDKALYEALTKAYHFYLMTTAVSPPHLDKLNVLVRENSGNEKYSIADEPEDNKFGKMLVALVINPKSAHNSPPLDHMPETASTWSFALHFCLRNTWTPDEALAEMQAQGIRSLAEQERLARQPGEKVAFPDPDDVLAHAIETVAELPPIGEPIPGDAVKTSFTQTCMMIGRVEYGETDAIPVISVVDILDRDHDELARETIALAHRIYLDVAPAGPIIQLIRLGAKFYGNATARSGLVSVAGGNTWFVLGPSRRSTKAASHLVVQMEGIAKGLEDNSAYLLADEEMADILQHSDPMALAQGWEFTNKENEEAKAVGVPKTDFFLSAWLPIITTAADGTKQSDDGSEQKHWVLGSGVVAEDAALSKKPTSETAIVEFTMTAAHWQALLKFSQGKHTIITKKKSGEIVARKKQAQAPAYEFKPDMDGLYITTFDTDPQAFLDLDIPSTGAGNATFKLQHKMIDSLSKLRGLSVDGALTFIVGEDYIQVSAKGKRGVFSAMIHQEVQDEAPELDDTPEPEDDGDTDDATRRFERATMR